MSKKKPSSHNDNPATHGSRIDTQSGTTLSLSRWLAQKTASKRACFHDDACMVLWSIVPQPHLVCEYEACALQCLKPANPDADEHAQNTHYNARTRDTGHTEEQKITKLRQNKNQHQPFEFVWCVLSLTTRLRRWHTASQRGTRAREHESTRGDEREQDQRCRHLLQLRHSSP